jgi:hypothetical protein
MSRITSIEELSSNKFLFVGDKQYEDFITTMIDLYTVNGLFNWVAPCPIDINGRWYNNTNEIGVFKYPFDYVSPKQNDESLSADIQGVLLAFKSLNSNGFGGYLRNL